MEPNGPCHPIRFKLRGSCSCDFFTQQEKFEKEVPQIKWLDKKDIFESLTTLFSFYRHFTWFFEIPLLFYCYIAEVPGSLVPESKLRDSRFKSRLGIGLRIEFKAWKESESVSDPKLRYSQSRNRNRNRKYNLHRLFTQFLLLFHWKYGTFCFKRAL